jgi:four helix bundle protein
VVSEKITSFTQLRAWQHSRALASDVYKLSQQFPQEEKFGITSQIRRSAVSVAGNIAEGFSRNGTKDKVQFYAIALGSLTETLSHAYICNDLGFMTTKDLQLLEERVINIHKMINGLIKSVQRRNG